MELARSLYSATSKIILRLHGRRHRCTIHSLRNCPFLDFLYLLRMRGNNDGNDKYQRTAKTRTTVTKKHKLLFFVSKSKRQRVTCSGLRETILSIPTEKYLLLCLLLNVHSKLSWSADNKSLGIASCQLTEEQWLISLTVDSSKPNSDAAGSGYQKIKPHLSGWRRARACGTSRAGLIGYRQHWFWNQSPQFGLSLMLELPWVRWRAVVGL